MQHSLVQHNGEPVVPYKVVEDHDNKSDKDSLSKVNQIGGALCAVILVLDWVAMSEVIPMLQSNTNYSKPYFMRYFVGSFFSLMIIPWFLLNRCRCNAKVTWSMMSGACLLSYLYNGMGYLWYLSLNATIAAINSTLLQSSVAIAYIFSVLLLPNYNMSWIKNFGVFVCLSGVAVVGYGTRNEKDDTKENTWYGIVEVLIGMVTFGFMEVVMSIVGTKHFSDIGDGLGTRLDSINSKVFMQAMMGIASIFTFWPGILILDVAKVEEFRLPQNKDEMLVLLIPAVMDTVYAGALIIGIALTNPVFIAVAQLLVIPAGFMYDSMFNGLTVSAMAIVGSVLIFIGFLIMELPVQKYVARWRGKGKDTSEVLMNHEDDSFSINAQ